MKDYELTVIFHPDLEMNLDPAIEKAKKIITSAGGEITKEENDGKKRLAYKVGTLEFGIYYFVDAKLSPDAIKKIDGSLNIADEVIRHMIVKEDPLKVKLEARRKEEGVDEEAAEEPADTEEVKTTEEKGE